MALIFDIKYFIQYQIRFNYMSSPKRISFILESTTYYETAYITAILNVVTPYISLVFHASSNVIITVYKIPKKPT